MNKKPPTIYPLNVEKSYARSIVSYIDEMERIAIKVVKKEIYPIIEKQRIRADGYREDFSFELIKKVLKKLNVFFYGIMSEKTALRESTKFVNSINVVNEANVAKQLAVRGVNPIKSSAWLRDFVKAKAQENAAYISTIPDEFYNKVAQSVMRTVSEGGSLEEIVQDIQKQGGVSRSRAEFIARDQTGSILGQITAERHQRAGFPAFRWSDSDDNRVRPTHREKNNKIFLYADDPLLPGEDYGCRCIAEPVDYDELEAYNKEIGKG